ncbi:MAG: DinB family protein, partial [Flavobacteriaceae bacterium]
MEPIVEKLENLVEQISTYVSESSEEKLSRKWSPNRWSKKELLGHLIDSGMYNLQRFTEIQFEEKPYRLKD